MRIYKHDELNEAEYHTHPALSQSTAKRMLDPGGPAKVRWDMLNGRAPNPTFDFGHAVHKLVLGVGEQVVDVGESMRTAAAKEAEAEARSLGRIPLRTAEVRKAEDMAEAVARHPQAAEILSNGTPELSLFGEDPRTGVPIRGRIDWCREDGVLVDYKTARNADPDKFSISALNYGYCMQAPWYLDLAAQCGLPAKRFVFIVQEKDAPYLVNLVELDVNFLDLGRERIRDAIDIWNTCQTTGEWPGYPNDITSIAPPIWAWDGDDIEIGD